MPALSRRAAALAAGAAVLMELVPGMAAAQLSASLDAGASLIRYDQFQTSWAIAATPVIRLDRGLASIAAAATILRFESGHRDVHGSLMGTMVTPRLGPVRVELSVDGGASRYLSFPTFGHLLGGVHVHLGLPRRSGLRAGVTVGPTWIGGGPRAVTSIDMGYWASREAGTVVLSAARSHVGDTTYTDLTGTVVAGRGWLEVSGLLGARLWSRGGGRGVYGEASATAALWPHVALVIGAGRYPTDPTRGTIAGRYLTLGVHLSAARAAPADPDGTSGAALGVPARRVPAATVGPALELRERRGGLVEIEVRVPGAHRVEVMGDFTDWQPLALSRRGADRWTVALPLAPGPHHVEVRVDGGAWRAPAGMTRVVDEFGAEGGLLVVP